jgi:hypothetical protein
MVLMRPRKLTRALSNSKPANSHVAFGIEIKHARNFTTGKGGLIGNWLTNHQIDQLTGYFANLSGGPFERRID